MLYRNCRELPYNNFNEIMLEGDLTFLIKDKAKHSEKELLDRWDDITDEYSRLTDNFTATKFFRDKAELKFLERKISVLTIIDSISHLELTEDQKLETSKILKKYRVSDVKQSLLEATDDLNLKIKSFDSSYNQEKKSNFEEELAWVRTKGCSVNRYEITVTEWIALIELLKKQSLPKK